MNVLPDLRHPKIKKKFLESLNTNLVDIDSEKLYDKTAT